MTTLTSFFFCTLLPSLPLTEENGELIDKAEKYIVNHFSPTSYVYKTFMIPHWTRSDALASFLNNINIWYLKICSLGKVFLCSFVCLLGVEEV